MLSHFFILSPHTRTRAIYKISLRENYLFHFMCAKYFMYEIKDKSKLSTALHIVDEFIIPIFATFIFALLRDYITTATITFLRIVHVVQVQVQVCVCLCASQQTLLSIIYCYCTMYGECKKFRHEKKRITRMYI